MHSKNSLLLGVFSEIMVQRWAELEKILKLKSKKAKDKEIL